ncbi:unnamed protein product, partial [Schistosoma curassoni]|uniref:DHC_N1 domain-containing protein n=1 Tax=Schistosoma curassoni TaxID=6186 RepID=A0A183L644_9TREM
MANQANKLIYPSDFMKVLQISMNLLKMYNPYETISNNNNNNNNNQNNDISFALNVLSSTMNIIHSWFKTIETFTNTIDQSLINEINSIKQNIHYIIINLINQLLSSQFKPIWLQLLQDNIIKYNKLLPELNRIFLFISNINEYSQLNSCYTLRKLRKMNVASYSLSFQLNNTNTNYNDDNNCLLDNKNPLMLNISHLTNSG